MPFTISESVMRLSYAELKTIIITFSDIFKNGKIFLFGSRVDDSKKGGDIDLYIESTNKDNILKKKIDFIVKLNSLIGEQRIDVIVQTDKSRPIEIEAKKTGVELNLNKIKIKKYFNECDKHIQRINEAYVDIKDSLPLSSQTYQNLTKEQVQDIDQYLFRFAKLQDVMGDKVFRTIIQEIEGNSKMIPFIDVLNLLEKLDFINSSKEWLQLRVIRNDISHQYDDEPEAMSQAVNNIFNKRSIILEIYTHLKNKYELLS
jgi:predicted nucleotidyltransferase